MIPTPRDIMAPDTEPTDEELALVMRAARDAALQRKREAEQWLRERLEEALAATRARVSHPSR